MSALVVVAVVTALSLGATHDDVCVSPAALVLRRFIHIPKNGGSSIEKGLWRHRRVAAGAKLASSRRSVYSAELLVPPGPCSGREHNLCSPWHTPPHACVRGSYCVVRDPFDRMLSELHMQTMMGVANASDCTCSGFQAWLRRHVGAEVLAPGVMDCHFMPQWAFARRCSALSPMEGLHDLHARALNFSRKMGGEPRHPRCLRALAEGCSEGRALAHALYARDLELHRAVRDAADRCPWPLVRGVSGAAPAPDVQAPTARILNTPALYDAARLQAAAPECRSGLQDALAAGPGCPER